MQSGNVKPTSTHMGLPDLLIPHDQELVADAYPLAHRFELRKVRLIDWAPRHVVEDRGPEQDPGNSLNYVFRPNECTYCSSPDNSFSCFLYIQSVSQ